MTRVGHPTQPYLIDSVTRFCPLVSPQAKPLVQFNPTQPEQNRINPIKKTSGDRATDFFLQISGEGVFPTRIYNPCNVGLRTALLRGKSLKMKRYLLFETVIQKFEDNF